MVPGPSRGSSHTPGTGTSQRVHMRPEEEDGEQEHNEEELEEHPTREVGASIQEEVLELFEEFSEEH